MEKDKQSGMTRNLNSGNKKNKRPENRKDTKIADDACATDLPYGTAFSLRENLVVLKGHGSHSMLKTSNDGRL